MTAEQDTYFRKGFGLGKDVQGDLASDYAAELVDLVRSQGNRITAGDVTLVLAQEFGFCYGVERAVEYAYQTRAKFPDRRLFVLGEIIHNPQVNRRLRSMQIEIVEPRRDVKDGEPIFDLVGVTPNDVVLLPAFGVTMADFQALRAHGCVVVDTTCGSVLNVWKRVDAYARGGFTALIHGKYYHEETRATASQVLPHNGAYVVVRDMGEAEQVIAYIEALGSHTITVGQRESFGVAFAHASSPGFDPDVHLRKIGVANQTTMLASESLAIGERVGRAMSAAWGVDYAAENFRTFDTICSATQDRQDAVLDLLKTPPDVMVVVGGYNSSNTISLATLCQRHVATYHIDDPRAIDVDRGAIRYRVAQKVHEEREVTAWLPTRSPLVVGLTAGASTPNSIVGATIAKIFASRGLRVGS